MMVLPHRSGNETAPPKTRLGYLWNFLPRISWRKPKRPAILCDKTAMDASGGSRPRGLVVSVPAVDLPPIYRQLDFRKIRNPMRNRQLTTGD